MDTKKFLNAEEVAAEFGLDADALKQLIDSGDLHALADRGTWKFRRDELQALVDSGKIQLPEAGHVLTFQNPDDDVSYIELDEDALAEQATMITRSNPVAEPVPGDSFVAEPAAGAPSEGEASIATGSDSDVTIAPDYSAGRPEDSGILLDFNLDAGATVSSSGSSLRLPQTVPGAMETEAEPAGADEPVWGEESAGLAVEDSSVVSGGDDSHLVLEADSGVGDSAVGLGGDSAINLPAEESGILLDEGSHVGMTTGSSVLATAARDLDDDSGLAMDDSGLAMDDSGLTLENAPPARPDSGIALSDVDSGISLGGMDSGLSLEADSGLSLGSRGADANAPTVADDDEFSLNLGDDGDRTQTLELSSEFDEDSAFDINLDEGDATSELLLGDDEDADETSATVVRKGRPAPGSLSAAFELDEPAEVEDLEISHELDEGIEDDVEDLAEVEEVFDASEDAFGDELEAAEEEDYLGTEAEAKTPKAPREPAWGAGMVVGLVACTLFLAANSLILWTGVSTMWDGANSDGPGGTLIQTFAELIKM